MSTEIFPTAPDVLKVPEPELLSPEARREILKTKTIPQLVNSYTDRANIFRRKYEMSPESADMFLIKPDILAEAKKLLEEKKIVINALNAEADVQIPLDATDLACESGPDGIGISYNQNGKIVNILKLGQQFKSNQIIASR